MVSRLAARYARTFEAALAHRRQTARPPIKGAAIALLSAFIFSLIAALLMVPEGQGIAYQFASEHGFINTLSGICLGGGSAFAFGCCYLADENAGRRDRLFWLLFGLALAFLATDEFLQFHERIGELMSRMAIDAQGFRNWNDIIVIGYGAVAIVSLLAFLPTLMRYPLLPELMLVAVVFYGLHTVIDITQEPSTHLSHIAEESNKLACSATLMFTAFATLKTMVWNRRPAGRP